MKMPRISIHSLMAIVAVVALDCMMVRAINDREGYFTRNVSSLLLTSLPMLHVLALGAALLARGPIRARPFLLGFEIGGGLAILIGAFFRLRIFDGLESIAESTRVIDWLESQPDSTIELVSYLISILPFLLIQLIAGLAVGWLVRRFVAPRGSGPALRPRFAPPWIAVLVLAVPALATVGYLRWIVDPQELRRPAGSEAIVDLSRRASLPSALPKGSPLITLDGIKVRIERDEDPCMIEVFAYSNAPRVDVYVNDYRMIRVTLLDGDRVGEAASVPHCFLKPIR